MGRPFDTTDVGFGAVKGWDWFFDIGAQNKPPEVEVVSVESFDAPNKPPSVDPLLLETIDCIERSFDTTGSLGVEVTDVGFSAVKGWDVWFSIENGWDTGFGALNGWDIGFGTEKGWDIGFGVVKDWGAGFGAAKDCDAGVPPKLNPPETGFGISSCFWEEVASKLNPPLVGAAGGCCCWELTDFWGAPKLNPPAVGFGVSSDFWEVIIGPPPMLNTLLAVAGCCCWAFELPKEKPPPTRDFDGASGFCEVEDFKGPPKLKPPLVDSDFWAGCCEPPNGFWTEVETVFCWFPPKENPPVCRGFVVTPPKGKGLAVVLGSFGAIPNIEDLSGISVVFKLNDAGGFSSSGSCLLNGWGSFPRWSIVPRRTAPEGNGIEFNRILWLVFGNLLIIW